eukprot:152632-Chlamydomonas_euryale.AAC.5
MTTITTTTKPRCTNSQGTTSSCCPHMRQVSHVAGDALVACARPRGALPCVAAIAGLVVGRAGGRRAARRTTGSACFDGQGRARAQAAVVGHVQRRVPRRRGPAVAPAGAVRRHAGAAAGVPRAAAAGHADAPCGRRVTNQWSVTTVH